MVHTCVVCNVSTNNADKRVIFHQFPKDAKQRKKWMKILNIDVVRSSTYICSQHFEKNQYKGPLLGPARYLRVEAVPSLHIPQKNKKNVDACNIIEGTSSGEEVQTKDIPCTTAVEIRRSALKRPHSSLVDEAECSSENNLSLDNVFRLGDINIDKVSKSPADSKMCLEVAMETIYELRKKIKRYRTTVKRLEDKVSNLQSLVDNLRTHNLSLMQKH